MAETEDTAGLEDIAEFVSAMGSRYGRVPALKKLGRLIGSWFLVGLVFVVVCIIGETVGVGVRKAAAMYWRWWVGPPFVLAVVPLAFTVILAVIQLAFYAVMFPFALIGELMGHSRAAFFKRASNWILYLGFGLFVAWAAHDSAKKDAAPKPATKAVAATATATSPLRQPQTTAAPTTSGHLFDWRIIVIALLAWCGGVAQTTFSSVTSTWAKRFFFDDRREVVLYGPDNKPK